MTIALCLNCGKQKVGAFSDCPHCGVASKTEEEMTKSLMMSDHHVTIGELDRAGEKIKNGEDLEFDEQALRAMWVSRELIAEAKRLGNRRLFACLSLVILLIAAISFVMYLALR